MLEVGTTVYEVHTPLYNGRTTIKEIVIRPHHTHIWNDPEFGPTEVGTTEGTATADITDLVTHKTEKDVLIGVLQAQVIEKALKEGLAETSFGYIYAERRPAAEDYNRHIQSQIDWLESRKLALTL